MKTSLSCISKLILDISVISPEFTLSSIPPPYAYFTVSVVLAGANPKVLVLYELSEFNLYSIHHELEKSNNNVEIIKTISFPDHYNFTKKDILNLNNKAKELHACLVTTEKDYMRLNKDDKKNINCLKIQLLIDNKDEFINELKKII